MGLFRTVLLGGMTRRRAVVSVVRPRVLLRAESSVLLVIAAAARLATVRLWRDMGVLPGTMGLGTELFDDIARSDDPALRWEVVGRGASFATDFDYRS